MREHLHRGSPAVQLPRECWQSSGWPRAQQGNEDWGCSLAPPLVFQVSSSLSSLSVVLACFPLISCVTWGKFLDLCGLVPSTVKERSWIISKEHSELIDRTVSSQKETNRGGEGSEARALPPSQKKSQKVIWGRPGCAESELATLPCSHSQALAANWFA